MVGPRETNAPLVIDADTVLAFAIACQRFKPVAGQDSQVPKGGRRLQPIQLHPGGAFNARKRFHSLARPEVAVRLSR